MFQGKCTGSVLHFLLRDACQSTDMRNGWNFGSYKGAKTEKRNRKGESEQKTIEKGKVKLYDGIAHVCLFNRYFRTIRIQTKRTTQ